MTVDLKNVKIRLQIKNKGDWQRFSKQHIAWLRFLTCQSQDTQNSMVILTSLELRKTIIFNNLCLKFYYEGNLEFELLKIQIYLNPVSVFFN